MRRKEGSDFNLSFLHTWLREGPGRTTITNESNIAFQAVPLSSRRILEGEDVRDEGESVSEAFLLCVPTSTDCEPFTSELRSDRRVRVCNPQNTFSLPASGAAERGEHVDPSWSNGGSDVRLIFTRISDASCWQEQLRLWDLTEIASALSPRRDDWLTNVDGCEDPVDHQRRSRWWR